MSKRNSEELDNFEFPQPAKRARIMKKKSKSKSQSKSKDKTDNESIDMSELNKNKNDESQELTNDYQMLNLGVNMSKSSQQSHFTSFQSSISQSIHILGNNTVELSHAHNDGTESKLTQEIIHKLTQLFLVSNMKLLIPNIINTPKNNNNSIIRLSLPSSQTNIESKDNNNEITELKMQPTEVITDNKNINKNNDNNISDNENDNETEDDDIEAITKNDEICHNKLANLLKINLKSIPKLGKNKVRKIDINIEGFKGTRARSFRAQSQLNTPTMASTNSIRSMSDVSITSNISGLSNLSSLTKTKTDRLIYYRDEINEKLFEYTDIILLFPDDNFDVLLNLFEFLRLCELGRTRNTSNQLFSEGIDSMGKVIIFNLNGFYNGLNKQFNCYDEDKVENRFVVCVVDTIDAGIERIKIWNREDTRIMN